jgi:hypothetical protein
LAIWTVALGAGIVGALYALAVRDPRCYILAFLSPPVVLGLSFGNATLLLVPLVALAWRWRDDWIRVGACVALAIAAKLFLWPVLFWLLGTRRYRAFAAAVVASAAAVVLPWAVIGFDGVRSYPSLLRVAEEVYAVHSFSVATMLSALGAHVELATRGGLAVGLGLGAAALLAGRRRADEISISLAVLAAVLGSPIVWPFYYALLLVPLAIVRPRLSALWLLPTLFYFTLRLPTERVDADDMAPGGIACCRPDDVPAPSWVITHSPPGLWPAVGHALVALALMGIAVWSMRRSADELTR